MPSNMSFDPFRRFRLRSNPVPTLLPSSEEDSDVSSPERDRPHVIRITSPKNDRKSGERLVPESEKGAPDKMTESAHIALTLDKAPHLSHPERPAKKKPSKAVLASDSVDALQPPAKSTLIRRVTSKLVISIPLKSNTQPLRSRPSTRILPTEMGLPTQGPRPAIPTLPNSFVSRERREAALRERGLRPPRKDLSEQEREEDDRLTCLPSPASMPVDGSSEAEQFKAGWLAMNRTSESSDSECGPPVPPSLQAMKTGPQSTRTSPSSPVDADILRRSSDGRTDLPFAGRPSICSSVPPLSTSYLEVLHEEPSEQGPITPPPPLSPANLPIIVSSPHEFVSSPVAAESPISCTFSSHCPGSTLESQSQSGHSHFLERESIRSFGSRGRRSDSGDRPRKVVGSSMSRLGTRSLSNLRRSVAGSLRMPSTTSLSSTDPAHLTVQAPRTAISPTMHSLGSIIRETRDITDAESRRLSELAFLD